MFRVFSHTPEARGSILGQFIPKTQKCYLISQYCKMVLYTQYCKIRIKVQWSNQGKIVAHFPTPRCSSYWKGNLRVALDYGRQTYLLNDWIDLCKNMYYIRRLVGYLLEDLFHMPHKLHEWHNRKCTDCLKYNGCRLFRSRSDTQIAWVVC